MVDFAVEGMMSHVAAVGSDGRHRRPVGLSGQEVFREDTVVAYRTLFAEQIDVESVGPLHFKRSGDFADSATGKLDDTDRRRVVLILRVALVGVGSHFGNGITGEIAQRVDGVASGREPDRTGNLF